MNSMSQNLIKILFFITYIIPNNIFASIEQDYKRQIESTNCSYENAQYYSPDSQTRYCISGGYWKSFTPSGSSYSEGVLNKSLKNYGLLGSNTIFKYKVEGDNFVRYSCKGTSDAFDFDCIGPVERDVFGISGNKGRYKQLKSSEESKCSITLNEAAFISKQAFINYKYNSHFKCAQIKSKLGDYAGAINQYSIALKYFKNDPPALNNRGNAKLNLGDKKGGCIDFKNSSSYGNKTAINNFKNKCNEINNQNRELKRGNSIYVIVDGPSWEEAQLNAKKLGGHLVTINDESENNWIVSNIGIGYWIGITDKFKEGRWEWISGEEVEYTNWEGRNNAKGNQNYGWLHSSYPGKWDDNWNLDSLVSQGIAEIKIP